MKRYIRDAWVALLRSGKYRQGKFKLCTRDEDGYSFCCLGILTEMYQSAMRAEGEEPLEEVETKYADEESVFFYYRDMASGLPAEVIQWSNLTISQTLTLAALNDDGASFSQIADYIERM